MTLQKVKEKGMEFVFMLCACVSILAVALICIFLFANGVPAMAKIGFGKFLLGRTWQAGNGLFGIFIMMMLFKGVFNSMASIYVTAGAIIVGVPIGILAAVFLARFCPKPLYRIMKPGVELLAGIPSVVYGFFGLMIIVPWVRDTFRPYYGGNGLSLFSAALLLGIMILPTIISISESAIRAVPDKYYQGALALGATHERSVFRTVVPAAKSGIMAGIVLGIGRAFGETMAVIMIAGNQAWIPDNMFQGIRTLTANIVMEMGYAQDLHREALIATGVVLFVFILIINTLFSILKRREAK